jgi:predicted  nucleic acid-binding Zn-ribbon protein
MTHLQGFVRGLFYGLCACVFALVALALLTGCEDVGIRENVYVPDDQRAAAATFVTDCARAANPMSDEEGEDLVRECAYQARQLYGNVTRECVHETWGDYVVTPCDRVRTEPCLTACRSGRTY